MVLDLETAKHDARLIRVYLVWPPYLAELNESVYVSRYMAGLSPDVVIPAAQEKLRIKVIARAEVSFAN